MKRKSPPPKKANAPPPNPMKRSVINPMISSSSSSQSERASRLSSAASSPSEETSRRSSSSYLEAENTPSPSSSYLQAEKTTSSSDLQAKKTPSLSSLCLSLQEQIVLPQPSSSVSVVKTPPPPSSSSIPAEKAQAPAPAPIKNVIPRYLQRPTPKDMTPEEWRKLHEYSEKLRELPRGQWELEDLLWTCPEYHQDFISKEEGLKKMQVLRKYYQQLYDSEGFDCDYKPELGLPPGHIFKLNCTKRFLGTYFKDLAAKALQSYNKKCNPKKFEVLEVQKVNATEDVYRTYYLTFTAKDVSSCYGSTRVFQACIFTPWTYENKKNLKPKIHLCRMKPRSICSMSLRG